MLLKDNDRIVFIGDSVTDFGRGRPVGEGLHDGVGTGFVRLFHSFINAYYPELRIRISNTGISGNNILDLKSRWQNDVLDLDPDWVNVMIGVNDVWRQFDSPDIFDKHITPEVFEATYRELIENTLPHVKGMLLCTPYYMEKLKEDEMRSRMDIYTEIVRKLAKEYGTLFVDVQAMFDRYFTYRHSSFVAWDRIHPNQVGAMLIASEICGVLGFDRKVI